MALMAMMRPRGARQGKRLHADITALTAVSRTALYVLKHWRSTSTYTACNREATYVVWD